MTHEALRNMVLDLESLDATIVQFDPDFQVETIKPKAFPPPDERCDRGKGHEPVVVKLKTGSSVPRRSVQRRK
jgi:hypothetical protein